MSRSIEVDYTGEGRVDAQVARRLILAAGHVPGRDFVSNRPHKGKDALDLSLKGLNAGAPFGNPVLVLRDLDHDAPCAGEWVADLSRTRLGRPQHKALLLRVAVRSVEAWLMADAKGLAQAGGLRLGLVPRDPEAETNPKATLVSLLCRHGDRHVREALRIRSKDERPTDQVLGAWIAEFVADRWDVEAASRSARAPSLSRCLARLRGLGAT
jgi:hypothetical protein